MTLSVALIGCGKMGQALLGGWRTQGLDLQITVIQPTPLPDDVPMDGFVYAVEPPRGKTYDILVFAVKPQILELVAMTYRDAVHDTSLIISIAAGKKIQSLEALFGRERAIIRAMPNTPAAIGRGLTALVKNAPVSASMQQIGTRLFDACGSVLWIEEEAQMDAVTAVSGSGPAYLFYFIEALSKSAEALGFSPETAETLARQTIIGAAALADHDANISAATLRQNVTSPGGTTEAALKVLMAGDWQDILTRALQAAELRGKDLNR
ncbi:MAG: pyrroline-5-carboxylate reductase [Rhodospirillales bacterium]|nr:pyrroline-5-carboxylate reductase [Rhodospirillales bacterium]MCB9973574.1 pyrroline-5-carboxylate reductase [Rhodospirillales bacterium]MCB9979622.1 pyrroline-5-carboxylate reductase [Rhodospirillales bacterium]